MTTQTGFTGEHAATLRGFLEGPGRPQRTLSYCEAAGLIFAVACTPEAVTADEWLPLLFDNEDPGYADDDEARAVREAAIALHDGIDTEAWNGRATLPPGCTMAAEPAANFGPEGELGQWARGLVAGHNWLGEVWQQYLPEEYVEEVDALVTVLGFFAGRETAREFVAEGMAVDEMAAEMLELYPEAMTGYARLGRAVYQALQEPGSE